MIKYSLYAWGCPILMGIIIVLTEKLDASIRPNFIPEISCFFNQYIYSKKWFFSKSKRNNFLYSFQVFYLNGYSSMGSYYCYYLLTWPFLFILPLSWNLVPLQIKVWSIDRVETWIPPTMRHLMKSKIWKAMDLFNWNNRLLF